MGGDDEGLERWIERQYRYAASTMLESVSATGIVKRRPGFGQTVRPRKGSVVASPILADWDPEPDYFFHWYRDSALVMDALRLLADAGGAGDEARTHFKDFVRFSLSLQQLDGRTLAAAPSWRENCATEFVRFLRSDTELARVHGDAVRAETRVNPDGTLDLSTWSRPQHDGAPLRALAVLHWIRDVPLGADFGADLSGLLCADLKFTATHSHEPCFDIWEEEWGLHYYTLCVSAAALEAGADWLEGSGDRATAQSHRAQAQAIRLTLDGFWLPEAGFLRSRIVGSGGRSPKDLDISVVLAAIHTAGQGIPHTVHDPRMQATLARLESLFDAAYPINQGRSEQRAPAMGRYAGDSYFSGGAFYFSTLGAAEFCFRASVQSADAGNWIRRGDAFLETVRIFTPASGDLSEQFDQRTGVQTSARHLAWSYAAFITCIATRRQASMPDHPDVLRGEVSATSEKCIQR
jgi:glucoamylase